VNAAVAPPVAYHEQLPAKITHATTTNTTLVPLTSPIQRCSRRAWRLEQRAAGPAQASLPWCSAAAQAVADKRVMG